MNVAPLLGEQPRQVGGGVADDARASTTISPPMVGVPALVAWPSGPSSRICWPIPRAWKARMRKGVPISVTSRPMPAAIRSATTRAPPRARPAAAEQRLRQPLEPGGATGLHEHRVARPQLAEPSQGGIDVGDVVTSVLRRAERDDDRDAERAAPDSPMPRVLARRHVAQLEHGPEHGDAPAGVERGEGAERGLGRLRVGVVGVVDDDGAVTGARHLHAPR